MDLSTDPSCFLSNGERKIMRVFITYLDERECLDIPVGAKVGAIKKMIILHFSVPQNNVQLGDEALVKNVLVLNYAGAELPDEWILSDLGISPGSTIKAYLKEKVDPILYLYIKYKDETQPILEKLKLSALPIADLRSLASRKTGLPVSIFRMIAPNGKEIYDCQSLESYEITPSSIITIEIWDGWSDLLKYSASGFTDMVLDSLAKTDEVLERFQLKVCLYVAAHFGHSELADKICRRGIRPDEPIGLHPLRQWTILNNPHVDTKKAPIHEAVECDQLDVLRNFALFNITSILSRDGYGLQPLNIALRRKMKKCASFLLTKQWSRIPFITNSIPLAIYHRLKLWSEKAKDRVFLKPGAERSTKTLIRSFPLVGQGVYIDGFSQDQISSRSKMPPRPSQFDELLDMYYTNLYSQYDANNAGVGGILSDSTHSHVKHGYKPGQSRRLINRSGYRMKPGRSRLNSTVSQDGLANETQSGTGAASKMKSVKLPKIQNNEDKQRTYRSRTSSIQSTAAVDKPWVSTNTTEPASPSSSPTKKTVAKTAEPPDNSPQQLLLRTKEQNTFPLPLKSINDTPRPHFFAGVGRQDVVGQSLTEYYKSRGYSSRNHAIDCLSISTLLKDKPWLSQVRLAMAVSRERVKKSLERESFGSVMTAID